MSNDLKKISSFIKNRKRSFLFRTLFNKLIAGLSITIIFLTLISALFSFTSLLIFINLFYISLFISSASVLYLSILRPILKNHDYKRFLTMLENENRNNYNYLLSSWEISTSSTYNKNDLTPLIYKKAVDSFPDYKNLLKPKVKIANILVFLMSVTLLFTSIKFSSPSIANWLLYPFNKNSVNLKAYTTARKIPRFGTTTLYCQTLAQNESNIELIITDLNNNSSKREFNLKKEKNGLSSFTIDSVNNSFTYKFQSGPLFSNIDTVKVIHPPKLYSLNVEVNAPYYTRKGLNKLNEGDGNITACYGSKANFNIEATQPLKECYLIKNRKDTINFNIDAGKAKGEFRLYSKADYTFLLIDSLNQKSDSTPSYLINIIDDQAPSISIVKPGRDKVLTEAQKETLNVELYDDYGISYLKLGYRKTNFNDPDTYFKKIPLKDKNQNALNVSVPLDIAQLTLYPGDSLYYWMETADNKPFGKPNTAVSDTFIFRLPTYSEIHKMIAEKEKGAGKALESVKDMQNSIEKSLEDLQSSAEKKQELSWEDKQIMKDLKQKLEEQSDSLNSAIEAMKEAVEKLKESGSSEKITEKMEEVQKELEKLLEEMGDSLLVKNDPMKTPPSVKDLQKALNKMTENLPNLEKRLENTIKYLKMLQKENERAMLASRAQKLSEEQFKISETLSGDELNKREADLQKRVDDLLKDTEKSLNDENSPVKSEDMNSLQDVQKSSENIQNEMSQNSSPSKSSMNQMSASLSAMSSELNSTLSSAMAEAARKDQENLMKMAQNSLQMAEWQKNINDNMLKNKKSEENTAASQQALKDALSNSTSMLNNLTVVPPNILADLFMSMQKSSEFMNRALQSEHNSQMSFQMNNATAALNELAQKLLAASDGMNQQGSGSGSGAGGLQQALQQLSGQQAAINSATQQLLQSMLKGQQPGQQPGEGQQQQQGGENSGLTGEAQRSVQKAQEALADKLKELSEKYKDSKDGNLQSRVEELEKEARRITRLFNNPQQEISEKQDLLLKRMLDATMSLNRKDEGKEERKSKSSENLYSGFTTDKIDNSKTGIDNLYKLRSKALSGKYPLHYKQKISDYFNKLQKHLLGDEE